MSPSSVTATIEVTVTGPDEDGYYTVMWPGGCREDYTEAQAATGKGNATKDGVRAAAVARWGPRADDPDIADACWIAEVCRLAAIKRTEEAAS